MNKDKDNSLLLWIAWAGATYFMFRVYKAYGSKISQSNVEYNDGATKTIVAGVRG